jgi:hypothetical protein
VVGGRGRVGGSAVFGSVGSGLVLGNVDGSSSLAMSMFEVAERSRIRLMLRPLMRSVGDPVLRWLLPCRTSRSLTPI